MDLVYLVQADTTVGFLSKNPTLLSKVKQRSHSKKILQTVDSFKTLVKNTRIPNSFKNQIRKSKLTTFIYPSGDSFRIIDKNSTHHNFISKKKQLFSTSANKTNQKFEIDYAIQNSDIQIFTKEDFFEGKGSKIFKISKNKINKIR